MYTATRALIARLNWAKVAGVSKPLKPLDSAKLKELPALLREL